MQKALLVGIFVWGVTQVGSAAAIGIGPIESKAVMEQPLQLKIPLIGRPENTNELHVHLANRSQHDKFSLNYPSYLSELTYKVVRKGNSYWLHVESTEVVSEPIVQLVLDIQTGDASVVREVVLLPEPEQPKGIALSSEQQIAQRSNKKHEPEKQQIAAKVIADSSSNNDYHMTRTGDSLWAIAARWKTTILSQQEKMDIILRHNPHAFTNGDSARLKVGVKIMLPSFSKPDTSYGDTLIAQHENTKTKGLDKLVKESSNELGKLESNNRLLKQQLQVAQQMIQQVEDMQR